MESEIEISRRFMIRLSEQELLEMMRWWEQLEVDPGDWKKTELGEKLYVQLVALRDGSPLNVESPTDSGLASFGQAMLQQEPGQFDRLRQRAQQGKPVVGGEWIEHD